MKNGWLQIAAVALIWWLLPVCSLSAQIAPQLDVHQLAKAVDDHYNHLHSLQAEFTETFRGEGAERSESGYTLVEKATQDALGIPFS